MRKSAFMQSDSTPDLSGSKAYCNSISSRYTVRITRMRSSCRMNGGGPASFRSILMADRESCLTSWELLSSLTTWSLFRCFWHSLNRLDMSLKSIGSSELSLACSGRASASSASILPISIVLENWLLIDQNVFCNT